MTFWGNASRRRALYTFCSPGDAARLRSSTCALLHRLHPKNEYPQEPPVPANIRPSAAAGNGLSGTVTAPFQRQRSQKV